MTLINQVKKEVIVINSQLEEVRKYKINVPSSVMERLDKVYKLSHRSIAHHVSAVVNNSFFEDEPYSDIPSKEVRDFAFRHSICAITGGAITDVLMNKPIKDFDVLYVTAEAGTYTVGPGPYPPYYFDFEGVEYPLSHVLGFLSMPHCYARINGVFQVYKSESNGIDFLFRTMPEDKRTGSTRDILNTILAEYDQDIKLGFYHDGVFYIHEDMYASLEAKKVGFNPSFLAGLAAKGESVSEKEIARLQKAREKYTPDVAYEDIKKEYDLEEVSSTSIKSMLNVSLEVVHPHLI